jgi:phosphohistidine phosphatase
MKHLTLIRHAKSNHDNPQLTDFQRPLSPRGLRDAPLIGAHLKATHRFAPDTIITSPALRAATTASIVIRSAGLDPTLLTEEPRIYEAPLRALVKVIQGISDTFLHAACFGHNPGFEMLANWLCGSRVIDSLRTGGVIMLSLDLPTWSAADLKTATLLTYFYPAQIGGGKDAPADAP